MNKTGTVIFLVSEDYFFLSHRMPMASAVRDMGYRVIVATRDNGRIEEIEGLGFETAALGIKRGNQNLFLEFDVIWKLARLIRRERPISVFCISLKPILISAVASFLAPKSRVINVFTGLGILFSGANDLPLLKRIAESVLRLAYQFGSPTTITQNPDDAETLQRLGIIDRNSAHILPGSGVDLCHFTAAPEPEGPVRALMVSRLLWDKGVRELVEASRLLKERNVELEVLIAGSRDDHNPRAVSRSYVDACNAEGVTRFLGFRRDVDQLWREVHIAVMPSYYPEGVPKCLLEAAASGRPIVTTDSIGCRELVPDGRTGILVPAKNPEALADALEALARDKAKRTAMGRAARALAETTFSSEVIYARTQSIFRSVIS